MSSCPIHRDGGGSEEKKRGRGEGLTRGPLGLVQIRIEEVGPSMEALFLGAEGTEVGQTLPVDGLLLRHVREDVLKEQEVLELCPFAAGETIGAGVGLEGEREGGEGGGEGGREGEGVNLVPVEPAGGKVGGNGEWTERDRERGRSKGGREESTYLDLLPAAHAGGG